MFKPAEADQIEGNIGGKSDETANFCNIVVTDDDIHAGSDSMGGNNGITTEAELRTAIENATGEKNTITLAEDIGLASTLEIPADKHIEIQGDGHSI